MFSDQDLQSEVQSIVDTSIANGSPVRTEWLAGQIMAQHPAIEGDDRDFYVLCAWAHVKTAVRSVVRRYKADEEGQAERSAPLLPGFERLQMAYHVERDGESCIVPIDQLSIDELRAKIREYHAMAEGCRLHAAELQRYLSQRDAA